MIPTYDHLLAVAKLAAELRAAQHNNRPTLTEWDARMALERRVDEALAKLGLTTAEKGEGA